MLQVRCCHTFGGCSPFIYIRGCFLAPWLKGGALMEYVTFSDLVQIGLLIVGIIGLFQLNKRK